jgi:hypothetical protein
MEHSRDWDDSALAGAIRIKAFAPPLPRLLNLFAIEFTYQASAAN